MLARIYCFISGRWEGHDVVACALAEDGTVLGTHISSSVSWAQRDIGYIDPSDHRRESFESHYPDGYVVEWVDDSETHEGLRAAIERTAAS